VRLRDLGSANGVRIGGHFVPSNAEVALPPGVLVEFGQATLVLHGASADVAVTGGMAQVRHLVQLAAPSMLNVLLLGETGSGKDVFAETIHRCSPRAAGPMVRLNCAALAESLQDSELFGYEKGAFTGAFGSKAGLVEMAHGGTLFLDEIGDMPLSIQAKLLRTIEHKQVRRVGATTDRTVDVRFVAATHRDLQAMVREGTFRQDLLFRINGIAVRIPPLRERLAEIVPLAQEFAQPSSLTAAAQTRLLQHGWPGNVRELKSAIERAKVLSGGGAIDTAHLLLGDPSLAPEARPGPAGAAPWLPPSQPAPSFRSPSVAPGATLAQDIEALERARIEAALAQTGGNQTRAAELLGLSRRGLVNRLEALDFPRPRRDKKS
jgi:transcriptional regulator with PAS, ATPase and Fis domain